MQNRKTHFMFTEILNYAICLQDKTMIVINLNKWKLGRCQVIFDCVNNLINV